MMVNPNNPKECEGVIATFHLVGGDTRKLRFQSMDKVRLGSKFNGRFFFGMAYVHDGTYTNSNNNHRDLDRYCEGCMNRGMWSFDKDLFPFLDVVKITKDTFKYEVEIDPYICQGD